MTRPVLCAATAVLASISAQAAEIRWTVHNITGEVTDVSTEGTLVEARTGADLGEQNIVDGTTMEINGATFNDGYTVDNPSHMDTIDARCGLPKDGNNPYYQLLRYADRQNEGDASVTFNGLTPGNHYQLQVWVSDPGMRTIQGLAIVLDNGTGSAPDPSRPEHATLLMSAAPERPGQYALGTFTADGPAQSFRARKWSHVETTKPKAESNTFINAVQLRDLGGGRRTAVTPATTPQPHVEVEVTRHLYDKGSDRYFLEWTSNPGETYGVYLVEGGGSGRTCIAAVTGQAGKTSFGPFTNPRPGNRDLRFEVGPPDLTPPTCIDAYGGGNSITLRFSEPMLSGPALDPANYTVRHRAGRRVSVTSACLHPGGDTVVLTTGQPLDAASHYTVVMPALSDGANLTLMDPQATFRTWDHNPGGVKVFILAGESNMVGYGRHDKGQGDGFGSVGSLRHAALNDPARYGGLLDAKHQWPELSNTMFWWNRSDPGAPPQVTKGSLTVGYGADRNCIGPEFGFALALQQEFSSQPVLIIKTAWSHKSLHLDFCPPGAAAARDGRTGRYYQAMVDDVRQVLDGLDREFPLFQGFGYQICGFGWHHGYIDMLGQVTNRAYEENLAMLIRDVRAAFGNPQLPVCIAATGQGGPVISPGTRPTLAGQLAVGDPKKYPEFAGTVTTVDTRPFQRDTSESPKGEISVWHHNGATLYDIGKAMGEAMLGLQRP